MPDKRQLATFSLNHNYDSEYLRNLTFWIISFFTIESLFKRMASPELNPWRRILDVVEDEELRRRVEIGNGELNNHRFQTISMLDREKQKIRFVYMEWN